MDELAEGLDGTDQARHGIGPAAGGAVNGDHRAGGRPAQLTQQPTLEPEVDPQPLGDGQYKLPVRNLGAYVFGDPAYLLQRPLLVA